MVNLKSASFVVITLLHEGLTLYINKKSLSYILARVSLLRSCWGLEEAVGVLNEVIRGLMSGFLTNWYGSNKWLYEAVMRFVGVLEGVS